MMNPRMDAPVKTGFHSRDTKALPVMFLGCPGAERRFPTKGGGANQESIRRTEGDEIHPVRASRTFHQRGYRLLYRIVARRDRISLVSQRHHRIDFHRSSRGHGAAQRSRNRQNQYNSDKRQRIAGRYTHQHHAQQARHPQREEQPIATPGASGRIPWPKTSRATSLREAPMAMCNPISRVRWLTACAFTAYRPIAASTVATPAKTVQIAPKRLTVNRLSATRSSSERTSSRARFSSRRWTSERNALAKVVGGTCVRAIKNTRLAGCSANGK